MAQPAEAQAAHLGPLDQATAQDALRLVCRELLAARTPGGYWEGFLASSALSTATALSALALAAEPSDRPLVSGGVRWLAATQNPDGGWGDTADSPSNLATTLLSFSALTLASGFPDALGALERAAPFVTARTGGEPATRAAAVTAAYGKDRTFAVPILMNCALAGLVEWSAVPALPCELAALPQSWYRRLRMQVVSYALPALIAVGLAVHSHTGRLAPLRSLTAGLIQRKLPSLQPASGGFLEATPLTAFVCMALLSLPRRHGGAEAVVERGLQFLRASAREDGSWPIDTNLSVWVTSGALQALELAGGLPPDLAGPTHDWLVLRQHPHRHPYTGAAAGGWAWTHLSGGVPDADDTAGALLALQGMASTANLAARTAGVRWLLDLQNADGGWPTFCRGWGRLPFDKSCDDLTAHAVRALLAVCAAESGGGVPPPALRARARRAVDRALAYLRARQRPDGSWVPLWFGNQATASHENPVLGTARVLQAWAAVDPGGERALRGLHFLVAAQNPDGGWGGAAGAPSTLEETALAVSALAHWPTLCAPPLARGVQHLARRLQNGDWTRPAPIGLYFASLWYSERLYPLIWCAEALGRVVRNEGGGTGTPSGTVDP